MGIKKFIKKVGSGIKNAASWAKDKFHKTANVVKKFAKPVLNVANKVSGVLSMVPGVVGTVASAINAGTGIANNVLDKIPNGSVKNKLTNVVNKASNKANDGVNKAANIGKQIQGGIQTAHNIANTVKQADISPIKKLLNQT